ncbi:MAG: UDP-glucose 4-epimerase [Gammaproteobacteria bacterium]|nr:MAG: UDP-glucose 4-epimerase [Gammaproteobacteria bacterium]TND07020.1 MAG: UDP-glucose 4-epimerase [Gammaproteobacteria bacterium]
MPSMHAHERVEYLEVGAMEDADWSNAVKGIDTIVHLAARVHVMNDTVVDPLVEYRKSNVLATSRLVDQAVKGEVRRFIYISTIKVNGERTDKSPFTEIDSVDPVDPYAISKWEAEQELIEASKRTGLEVVIIRPPLVYGPFVKGNLLTLIRLIESGVPLPLGMIDNRRSLLGVENLSDLIGACIGNPNANGEVFLASDGEDISTPELIRVIADALDRKARLFPVPPRLLTIAAGLFGKGDLIRRLADSLQVDSSKARRLLGWTPPRNLVDGVKIMARSYQERRSQR